MMSAPALALAAMTASRSVQSDTVQAPLFPSAFVVTTKVVARAEEARTIKTSRPTIRLPTRRSSTKCLHGFRETTNEANVHIAALLFKRSHRAGETARRGRTPETYSMRVRRGPEGRVRIRTRPVWQEPGCGSASILGREGLSSGRGPAKRRLQRP